MTDRRRDLRAVTRRHFYRECGVGLGKIALASLLAGPAARRRPAPADPLAPRPPHFAPKAKRVIYLFMAGAPSQLDLFDPKPALAKFDGKPVPAEVVKDQRYAFIQPDASLMASRFKFARHGQSGAELSEMLPHLAEGGRRHRDRQVGPHRPVQPRPGPDLRQHRLVAARPAEHGVVGDLRPGQRGGRPARLRRPLLGRGDQRRRGQLVVRVPARRLSGRPVPLQGRPDPQRRQPRGRRPPAPARHASTSSAASTAATSTPSATPRSRPGSPPTSWPTGCRPAPPS